MKLGVEAGFLDDLSFWILNDPKIAARILHLMEEIRRDPFRGTGKPEPLKHLGRGVWSRRITHQHRLVYQVEGGAVAFVQCRYHY